MISQLIEQIVPSLDSLVQSLGTDRNDYSLGLRRSARLAVLAGLYTQLKKPFFLITDRQDRALTLIDELKLWLPQVQTYLFPEPNPLFYENASWGMTTRRDRLSVLSLLSRYHIPNASHPTDPPVIVSSVRAVMTRSIPRREFLKATKTLKINQVVDPDPMYRNWVALGYEPSSIVITPGQIARRGGIMDIWVPSNPFPVRIELFGDEIDTLRNFDPGTQRTVQAVDRLQITPAREFVVSQKLDFDPSGIQLSEDQDEPQYHEFFIPIFHPHPATVLDFLPTSALILLDDQILLADVVDEIDEQAIGMRNDYTADELVPVNFPVPYLTWSEIEDSLTGRDKIDLGMGIIPMIESDQDSVHGSIGEQFTPGPRFGGQVRPALTHVSEVLKRNEKVVIITRQKARLQELWREKRVTGGETGIEPIFLEGSLGEGWVHKTASGAVSNLLTDGELFGLRRPEPRIRHRPVAEAPEAVYADMQVGDWVVHIDHGIGRFVDLVQRSVEGLEREYICVEYAQGDQLFVPVYQADRLTRYVGPDNRMPTPTRLGSKEWKTAKSKVKEAVEQVADDLLELYANRQVVTGYSFSADAAWQQELEASFPYFETEDQKRVIEEVKRDMEKPRPMDRLICGDVGYGKTEVALRAAFKSVMDGKQVAILVPTTVLAQQHFNTFHDRLASFPVVVEMLSRFRTAQQQKEIISRLGKGAVDIIIGTHRLIQDDVEFKDLGLLIIDEEQRFGVMHKEQLKKMRTEVDVLTMTATPIPRTLYMALTGVRDISTINTPPEERLPVITHIGPYTPRLVRQAVLREVERGGQVFFVHNRVQTIQGMRSHLEKLIPEVRIGVAHGQMPEKMLSTRMDSFSDGEIDVLLSTSIIESGLDIPNANTLIVDRADMFGLAQLYQLRGRVGRGAQRAYAYFFRHNRISPTKDGRQRLETIAENTQLGAGFSVAMRDLEIRGTGDILGTRQHGSIAAVGFHLYTRLLADAVRFIRSDRNLEIDPLEQVSTGFKLDQQLRSPVAVDLPLHLGIPTSYVPDRDTRLRLYRRIADLLSLSEIDSLEDEFLDRFGPLPEAVLNLFYQLKIRLLAEKGGLVSVAKEGNQIVLRYAPVPEEAGPREIPDVSPIGRTGKNAIWIAVNPDWQVNLLTVLEMIAN